MLLETNGTLQPRITWNSPLSLHILLFGNSACCENLCYSKIWFPKLLCPCGNIVQHSLLYPVLAGDALSQLKVLACSCGRWELHAVWFVNIWEILTFCIVPWPDLDFFVFTFPFSFCFILILQLSVLEWAWRHCLEWREQITLMPLISWWGSQHLITK